MDSFSWKRLICDVVNVAVGPWPSEGYYRLKSRVVSRSLVWTSTFFDDLYSCWMVHGIYCLGSLTHWRPRTVVVRLVCVHRVSLCILWARYGSSSLAMLRNECFQRDCLRCRVRERGCGSASCFSDGSDRPKTTPAQGMCERNIQGSQWYCHRAFLIDIHICLSTWHV